MTCPYLTDMQVLICTVHGGRYLPSMFELEEYCRSAQSKMCPYPSLMLFGIGRAGQREAADEEAA